MPTDAWRRSAGLLPLAALPSLGVEYPRPNPHIIASASAHCLGGNIWHNSTLGQFTASTWPGAPMSHAWPFVISHPFLVRKVFWVNGTNATTDSADVGVYDAALTLLVAGGGTAIASANVVQEVDVTDTLLKPGRYFMAYTQNGTTATVVSHALTSANARAMGLFQQTASAYPLPNPFVSAVLGSIQLPVFGIASRTLAS